MMRAAREAVARPREPGAAPLLIGVTVLTSLSDARTRRDRFRARARRKQVLRLARLAPASGLDGVVCSAEEAAMLARARRALRARHPRHPAAGRREGDQARVMTPEARAPRRPLSRDRPADHAVGRPAAALEAIIASIASGRPAHEGQHHRHRLRRPRHRRLPRRRRQRRALPRRRRAQDRDAQRGEIPIHEPGPRGDDPRATSAAGPPRFTTDVARAVAPRPLQFIAVGTPPDEDGSADLQYVLARGAQHRPRA